WRTRFVRRRTWGLRPPCARRVYRFLFPLRRSAVKKQGKPRGQSPERKLRLRPHMEPLEERCLLDSGAYRSITGYGNNQTLGHEAFGSANVALLRIAPAAYVDGTTPVAGSPARPSPRVISNAIVDQGDEDIVSDRSLSAMIYAWGQFLDHDLDLTT